MHDHHPTDAPPATGLLALELAEGAIGVDALAPDAAIALSVLLIIVAAVVVIGLGSRRLSGWNPSASAGG